MEQPKKAVLIGAGIMSATLGIFLKHLMPDTTIHIFERLDRVGAESSDAWNNAGTGHAAYCELNYTPMREGAVDISKALHISESFEVSKQFWTYLVGNDLVKMEHLFINDVPHWSFVMGEENVNFLKKRYEAMVQYPLFSDMVFEEDHTVLKEQLPLMMNGRPKSDVLATTKMELGTDVNFGAITRSMFAYLESCDQMDLQCGQEVRDLTQTHEGWLVEVGNMETGFQETYVADYVFIGAGGGSIPLLEKSDLEEGKCYGGFPVSGQWLRCTNPEVVKQHEAKVYGKAAKGNPPMSVPHLDTRRMNGERSLLFGPYAGFSTRFLKEGSLFDLPFSIEMHNIWPMLAAGVDNLGLTKYLVDQVIQSPEERFAFLQVYYPGARFEDWELLIAGQRVQIIKKDKSEGGVLKFGTEVVTAPDGSLAALLGASPGASTAVTIMLDTLKASFPQLFASAEWQQKIKRMIPSFGESLKDDAELLSQVRSSSKEVLHL